MKHFVTISFFIALFSWKLSAQHIDGAYKSETDSLVLRHGRATFSISGYGALGVHKIGEGPYEWVNDFLLVHTDDYSGDKTNLQHLNGSRQDSIVMKISTKRNAPIEGALIECYNAANKLLKTAISNDKGLVFITKNPQIKKMKVSTMGYSNLVFDYNPTQDYLIRMSKGDVIEKKTVVFKIKEINEETLSVLLVSSDFDVEQHKRVKELTKLDKKMQKRNLLDTRLKKTCKYDLPNKGIDPIK